jgi:hypothetical protein
MRRRTRRTSSKSVGLAKGFRSGLEDVIAADLKARGVPVEYESVKITYTVHEDRTYTPDFPLPNGIYVETKGYFAPEDRKKHLLIRKSRPELDIRFVFQNAKNKIRAGSKTTYADWCRKNGFHWAEGRIPEEWTLENKPKRRRPD